MSRIDGRWFLYFGLNQPDVPLVTVTVTTPDGRSELWARWWLLIFDPPWSPDGTWGDPGDWDDGGTWDSDASAETVSTVLTYLRRWTSARDRFYVRLYYSTSDVWGPETPWDHGTWDDASATFITWSLYP